MRRWSGTPDVTIIYTPRLEHREYHERVSRWSTILERRALAEQDANCCA